MTTKERVLALFGENEDTYLSGEKIAAELSISRAAVWKAVNSLRDDGYKIDAATNKGYRLLPGTDVLSAQGIRKYLSPLCEDLKIETLSVTESTNNLLRGRAAAGAPDGTVIAADSQTAGKGRMGRSFYSPSGTGIYMSLLLRPSAYTPEMAAAITTMAAAAECCAIEETAGKTPGIKWVNDIFIGGKKVSGILTEASFSIESGFAEYIVLGVGINAYEPDGGFPEDISKIAGAVYDSRRSDGKNALAASFLNNFMRYYTSPDKTAYVEKYRAANIVTGKMINVLSPQGSKKALALDIDDDCALIVRYEDGVTERLTSGEISIRLT